MSVVGRVIEPLAVQGPQGGLQGPHASLVPVDDANQVGELAAAWRIMPDSLLMLGWQRGWPAPAGTVGLQLVAGLSGRFTRMSWPFGPSRPDAYCFVAAVQLPKAEIQGSDTLILNSRRANDGSVLARLPASLLDPGAFGTELARVAPGAAAPAVARFLLELFTPATMAANPAIPVMLAAFLDHAAEPDGCIEVIGQVGEHCSFLQGWGNRRSDACSVILAGAVLALYPAHEASFARSDIAPPATGTVLVLPGPTRATDDLESVFLLDEAGLRRRTILPERRLLSDAETTGHIRDMLPVLRCDGETLTILAAALRPVYEGRFTLGESGHPVRLDIDLAVATPEAGSYLAGWLYDPAGVVESVQLRCTHGRVARIDRCWTRIPRPDVTEAFRQEPGLPPCAPGRDWHGFAVQVADFGGVSGDQARYLELGFSDGGCGFVPLTVAPVRGEAGRMRLLATVDLHKPSGIALIEQQLAPFFARLAAWEAPLIGVAPEVPAAWSNLLVVPLQSCEPPRALLGQFLGDPLAVHEGIVFVCGEEWSEAASAALADLARFYGAACVTLRVAGAATARVALELAARHARRAERFLLLGPATVGRAAGWRAALDAVSRAQGGTACISPTILYEDNSIRFGGSDGIEALPAAPYVRLRNRLAGLPAGFAPTGPALKAAGLSAACCLVPRRALAALSKLPAVVTPRDQAPGPLDLLAQLGMPCLWAPSIRVHASDDDGPADGIARVARLVAGWCMRAQLVAKES